jgi:hypothetical protein
MLQGGGGGNRTPKPNPQLREDTESSESQALNRSRETVEENSYAGNVMTRDINPELIANLERAASILHDGGNDSESQAVEAVLFILRRGQR